MSEPIDRFIESFLGNYSESEIEIQIKAKRILFSNIVMLVAAAVFMPFSLDENIFLPMVIGFAGIGFSISIFLLKNGRLPYASILHIIFTTFIIIFLHLFICDGYVDALTFIAVSFILIVDAVFVSYHISLLIILAGLTLLSQIAAPFLNLNGNLHLEPIQQIENFVLLSVFLIIIFTAYREIIKISLWL